jgi:hypothetical protein
MKKFELKKKKTINVIQLGIDVHTRIPHKYVSPAVQFAR